MTDDTGHGDGVQYVGLARSSAYTLVGFFGKFERTFDNLDFLPVVGVEVSVEQFLKFIIDELLFVGVLLIGRFHSSKSKKNKDKTSREQMQILFENWGELPNRCDEPVDFLFRKTFQLSPLPLFFLPLRHYVPPRNTTGHGRGRGLKRYFEWIHPLRLCMTSPLSNFTYLIRDE